MTSIFSRPLPFLIAFAVCLSVGVAYRVPLLSLRPVHGDEANQMVKTSLLLEKGVYRYDPFEHHGPSLYYLAQIPLRLCGVTRFVDSTEAMYRSVPLFFGIALLFLFLSLRPAMGAVPLLWALLLTSVSHAMVYYSRYYIQEILLVFFVFAALLSAYFYTRRPTASRAIMLGLAMGLAHATKETCVIAYACLFPALALAWLPALLPGSPLRVFTREGQSALRDALAPHLSKTTTRHALWTFLVAAACSAVLFSSFFTHARGPLDSLLTYTSYLGRAGGQGSAALHNKPWYYYGELLLYFYRSAGPRWSEGLIVGLALLGGISAFLPIRGLRVGDPIFHRFIAWYTLAMTILFCLIPYKTPWNMLLFFQPAILLAGYGAAWLIGLFRWKIWRGVVTLLLLGATAQLAWQSWQGNYIYPADARNPYVYAHTSTAIRRLAERAERIAAVSPDGRAMRIHVYQPDADYWPLPWYLRGFSQVGYWSKTLPETLDAPMLIVDPKLQPELDAKLKDAYQVEMHALRPNVLRLAYIRKDLWDAFIAAQSAPK